MENRIDYLFSEWNNIGGEVLLREKLPLQDNRIPEEVIGESTSYCRDSGRLTWVMLDWLIKNIQTIDENKLVKETQNNGNLTVLGVLCDLAYARNANDKFKRISAFCKPLLRREIFFHRVAQSPLATKLTKENPIDTFSRWNFLCNEVRYLHEVS